MEHFEMERMLEIYGLNSDTGNRMINSPMLPPALTKANQGFSKFSQLKESIIRDNALMLSRLYDYNQTLHHDAQNLFNMKTNPQFIPGHPLSSRIHSSISLQSKFDKLRQENIELKKQLQKYHSENITK